LRSSPAEAGAAQQDSICQAEIFPNGLALNVKIALVSSTQKAIFKKERHHISLNQHLPALPRGLMDQ
jgi:hypothetical protein